MSNRADGTFDQLFRPPCLAAAPDELLPLSVVPQLDAATGRYTLPAPLRATAHTEAGEVMALRHVTHPTHGVQFHPESFRTEHGDRLLANWLREVAA